MRHIIQQSIEIQPWPITERGESKFFGYVMAVGLTPDPDGGINSYRYADFTYGDKYERYLLPSDESLIRQLLEFVFSNIWQLCISDSINGKVWIELNDDGEWKVEVS